MTDTTMTMPVAPTGMMNGGFGGGWGNDWMWIIVLFLFGWGRNGFGGNGGGENYGGEIQRGFDHSATITKLDGITQGICDSTYALNNTITNGFHGVDSAICNLGYQTQAGFNALGHQIADCCCTTQRAIDGVNYNLATQACETRHAIQDSTRQILDFLTTDKISTLQAENQALKFQASQANQNAFITANQEAQTAELIRRLGRDTPVPSYLVPNPNCCYGNYGVNFNSGCGCGCG